MEYSEITKPALDEMTMRPNLDHEYLLSNDFDWTQMERELGTHNREELNLAYLAIDRYANSFGRRR